MKTKLHLAGRLTALTLLALLLCAPAYGAGHPHSAGSADTAARAAGPVTASGMGARLDARTEAPAARPGRSVRSVRSVRAGNRPGRLDPRCRRGRVLCVDKTSRTLRWVVDGRVRRTADARFGSAALPTREGGFRVARKSRDHVSSIYGTSMPFALFFSGGQAVHYSPDFAAKGYAGASHGCVNLRDRRTAAWLFDRVRTGDRVVVYRS